MFHSEEFWWGVIFGWILTVLAILICFFVYWVFKRCSGKSSLKKSIVERKNPSNNVLKNAEVRRV